MGDKTEDFLAAQDELEFWRRYRVFEKKKAMAEQLNAVVTRLLSDIEGEQAYIERGLAAFDMEIKI